MVFAGVLLTAWGCRPEPEANSDASTSIAARMRRWWTGTADVRLDVRDARRDPVAGLAVTVGGDTATTDAAGQALLEGIPPGTYAPVLPGGWTTVETVGVDDGATVRRLRVWRLCPGVVRVLDADGTPLADTVVAVNATIAVKDTGITDAKGEVWLAGRPCDIPLGVNARGQTVRSAPVHDGAPLEVRLREVQEATVVVVDKKGAPLDGELRVRPGTAERIGVAIWRVRAAADEVDATASFPHGRAQATIPLDGASHEVVGDPHPVRFE